MPQKNWLREILAGISNRVSGSSKDKIARMGVCGQMHGLVILDENNRVVRPAIL